MRKLQLDLDNILGPNGAVRTLLWKYLTRLTENLIQIRRIGRLLDKPTQVRYQLRENLDNLQSSANGAKAKAEEIKLRFDRLLKFVQALNMATRDRQGMFNL